MPAKTRKIVIEEQLKNKARADNYHVFLTRELKPYRDRNLWISPSVASAFIGGFSMRVLLSLCAICEYPSVFDGAICISKYLPMTKNEKLAAVVEPHLASKFRDYLALNLPDPATYKIYMDYVDQTLDQYDKVFQEKVDEVLVKKGFNSKNLDDKILCWRLLFREIMEI